MNIAMVCHPAYGGSGVVASELGILLAEKGHTVHFISYERPVRLNDFTENIFFHEVEIPNYPLFKYPPITLSIAAKIVEVCENENIDVVHAHYALPYSVCAYLAREMLKNRKNIRVVTTLHGTDISVVGQDKSFLEVVKFSIHHSDEVTCVSQYLKEKTVEEFEIEREITLIYNFINTEIFKPADKQCRCIFRKNQEKVLMHLSNFRPYKNVQAVIEVFAKIHEQIPSRLVLIGDGQEMSNIRKMVKKKKLEPFVSFLGNQTDVESILPYADLFIFPSYEESFGLALLEAMSCGVPFVASNIGGIPELAGEELQVCLFHPDDIQGMTEMGLKILSDCQLTEKMTQIARQRVIDHFGHDKIVEEYIRVYQG